MLDRATLAVAAGWPVVYTVGYVLQANTDPWAPRLIAVAVGTCIGTVPLLLWHRGTARGLAVGAAIWAVLTVALLPFLGLGLLLAPLAVSYGMLARRRGPKALGHRSRRVA